MKKIYCFLLVFTICSSAGQAQWPGGPPAPFNANWVKQTFGSLGLQQIMLGLPTTNYPISDTIRLVYYNSLTNVETFWTATGDTVRNGYGTDSLYIFDAEVKRDSASVAFWSTGKLFTPRAWQNRFGFLEIDARRDTIMLIQPVAGNYKLTLVPKVSGAHDRRPYVLFTISGPTAVLEQKRVASREVIWNYPNPFNGATQIWYEIQTPSPVTLQVFNLLGVKIASLLSEYLTPGKYQVTWEANNIPAGMYICKLTVGDRTSSRKITLLK